MRPARSCASPCTSTTRAPTLKLDPDTKLISAIGPALLQQNFCRCDGAAKQAQTAAAPVPSQPSSSANTSKAFKGYSLTELSAPGLLYNAQAKATYYKALGPLSKEPWLAKLDGPSPQNKPVKVAGADYGASIRMQEPRLRGEQHPVLLYSSRAGGCLRQGLPAWKFHVDRCATACRGVRARSAVEKGVAVAGEIANHSQGQPSYPAEDRRLVLFRCDPSHWFQISR